MEQETKMVFIAFASMTNYSNWKCQIALAANVLRICEVRINGILNYKQTLVGVSCIYAVSTSTDYEN